MIKMRSMAKMGGEIVQGAVWWGTMMSAEIEVGINVVAYRK